MTSNSLEGEKPQIHDHCPQCEKWWGNRQQGQNISPVQMQYIVQLFSGD
jgi:hypothetical protein